MLSKNTEHLVSVAIMDDRNLSTTLPLIERVLKKHFVFFELIVVQHISSSISAESIMEILCSIKNCRCIVVNHPVTYECSVQIVMEKSIGDFVLFFDPRTDNLELLPALVKCAAEGNDYVVVEYDSVQKNSVYSWAANIFYMFVYLVTGAKVPQYTSNFSCISRRLASALIEEKGGYIKLFAKQFGYKVHTFPTSQSAPNLSFKMMISRFKTALEIISESSARLISIASLLSLVCCIVNALYLLYVGAVYLFVPNVQAGWTTTSLLLASMLTAIFFVLFAIGLTCTSILKQNIRHKYSMISQELSSSDNIFDFNKLNVEGE